MENSVQVLKKKLKIELPYVPAIPLLAIHPEKNIIQKDTCTPVFIQKLFTIAKAWKQCKCPSTDEWIKKIWYHMIIIYMWNPKHDTNKLTYQTKTDSQTQETDKMTGWKRDGLGVWDQQMLTLCIEWINNKVLVLQQSTENYINIL